MKPHKCKKKGIIVVVTVILFSIIINNNGVHAGSLLATPHSPVKVLAAAGVIEPVDKVRYYTFSEEEAIRNDRGRDESSPPRSQSHHRHQDDSYSSKDPFQVPSLSEIAEMMRRGQHGHHNSKHETPQERDRDRDYHYTAEHRDRGDNENNPDSGWGWPKPGGSQERGRDRDRGRDQSGWAPPRPPRPLPPTTAPSSGWGNSDRDARDRFPPPRSAYGKGSYSPIDNKDAFRPWQIEGDDRDRDHGWGKTTTERPRYTPKYLASDEDKYKPIRYPPSSNSGWSDSRDQGRRPPPSQDGPGPVYLPPQREPPPLRDPPQWPTNSRDRDYDSGRDRERDRDRDRAEWGSRPAPIPRPSNGWDSDDRRPPPILPRPLPQPSYHDRDRDQDRESGKGWGWNKTPPQRPPPTRPTPGWGWQEDNRGDKERPRNPFEYKEGIDDLNKYLPPPIYEKAEYPPGFSRHRPPQKFENSLEDDSYPRAPNHYRIVAHTPSPEEIEKILNHNNKKTGHSPPPVSKTYLPPKLSDKDNERIKEIITQDKEKWYKDNFQKINSESSTPSKKTEKKTGERDDNEESQLPKLSSTSSSSASSSQDNGSGVTNNNNKPATVKRIRYDAQGFKYNANDHPVSKKNPFSASSSSSSSSQGRDIYSNFESNRDSFKRAVGQSERVKSKTENKDANKQDEVQGSESRTSFVRRTLNNRSQNSVWKNHRSSSNTTTISTIETAGETLTTTTRPRNFIKPQIRAASAILRRPPFLKRTGDSSSSTTTTEIPEEDFGRKINIIRNNRLKKEQGGFKPVSGPFGTSSSGSSSFTSSRGIREREMLMMKEGSGDSTSSGNRVIRNSKFLFARSSTSPSPTSSSTSTSTTTTESPPKEEELLSSSLEEALLSPTTTINMLKCSPGLEEMEFCSEINNEVTEQPSLLLSSSTIVVSNPLLANNSSSIIDKLQNNDISSSSSTSTHMPAVS